jgi:hypothetical protein
LEGSGRGLIEFLFRHSSGGTEDNHTGYVGFEVLTAVVMQITLFWDIMPCSPLKVTNVSEEHIASIFRIEK